jgi:pilus assembly protein Flp/PilA
MKNLFVGFVREEEGQDLIEYALLAGFISLVAVATVVLVGKNVDGVYKKVDAELAKVP